MQTLINDNQRSVQRSAGHRPPSAPDANGPAKKQETAATPANKLPVNLSQALHLIRATLLTLNEANRAGNYSVLRDLAAPAFQAKNSPADLALTFADLRNGHFDLFAAAVLAPTLAAPPHLDANGMLRLTGYFPTRSICCFRISADNGDYSRPLCRHTACPTAKMQR
jgi:hypothetical protein